MEYNNSNFIMYDKMFIAGTQYTPINKFYSSFTTLCSVCAYELDRIGMKKLIDVN